MISWRYFSADCIWSFAESVIVREGSSRLFFVELTLASVMAVRTVSLVRSRAVIV